LESAYFDPILIRRASRRLGLSSDSSYRFERGIDWDMVDKGSSRATALILKEAGGTVFGCKDVSAPRRKITQPTITISHAHIVHSLGVNISLSKCQQLLQKLGCKVASSGKGVLKVRPPSFRGDLKQKEDVVEEVARSVFLSLSQCGCLFLRVCVSLSVCVCL